MPPITFFKQSTINPREAGKTPVLKPRYALLPKVKIGPATLGIITIVIVLFMSLLYLIQANSTATKGYEIEKQQERIKTLQSQSEKLELEMARLRSTKELEGIPDKLNMKAAPEGEEIGSIQFVDNTRVAGVSPESDGLNPKQ